MKNTAIPVVMLLTIIVTAAILIVFYKSMLPTPIPGEPGNRPVKEIGRDIAAHLRVDGTDPAVVFSVDRKGAIQAFRVQGTKTESFKFPLPAATIKSMERITIFETANPKTCWIDGSGDLVCVVY